MNTSKNARLLLLALAANATFASAVFADGHPTIESSDWRLSFDGQYRLRGQFDSGKDVKGTDAIEREWLSHRARLGVTAERAGGPKLVLRLQDTRVWGEETDPLGGGTQASSALGLDIHEAYALIPLGMPQLTLQAGRQEINLDSQRLVGAVDWTQRARRFDGTRLRWNEGPLDVSAIATVLTERDMGDADGHVGVSAGDIWFGGLHGRYAVSDAARVSLLWLARKNDSVVPAANELRHTAGLYADGKVAGLSYTAEFYDQFGHTGAKDISAWMAGARLAYALPVAATPTIGLVFDELSGDGNAENAFDTLYATNHKYYGEVDMFLNIPKHTANRGLRDIGVTVAASPLKDLSVGADFHIFASHALAGKALTDAKDVQPKTDLGQELDVRATWKFAPGASLYAIYGMFLPGEAMRSIKKYADTVELTTEHFGALTLNTAF